MHLYTIYENGALRNINKIGFDETKVFIIDDDQKIYIWVGLKASKKKIDFGKKKAKTLNEKKKKNLKIEILEQNKEYGSFLAIMDLLKQGIDEKQKIQRRSELKLKVEDTKELIDAGIELDLEAEITLLAHEISKKSKSYEELSRDLAKKQLEYVKGNKKITENEIKKKMQEILKSTSTYEEICWLLAELEILKNKNKLTK
ncbi:MAG: hypothetical protein ACFFBP_05005 [Promethearchaeota archaeon]